MCGEAVLGGVQQDNRMAGRSLFVEGKFGAVGTADCSVRLGSLPPPPLLTHPFDGLSRLLDSRYGVRLSRMSCVTSYHGLRCYALGRLGIVASHDIESRALGKDGCGTVDINTMAR